MKILALSSSRAGNSEYLEPAIPFVKELAADEDIRFAFVPFASVGSGNDYYQKVKTGFTRFPLLIELATNGNAREVIERCGGIMVGGGNTFKLLHDLYELDIIELIRAKVKSGAPYIGWSAGANILGPTIATTNDMPIIQPKSFNALNIFPFHINPHYYNQPVAAFNGETRDQRIKEFLAMNSNSEVVALPEGAALMMREDKIEVMGRESFRFGSSTDGFVKTSVNAGSYL